MAIDDLDSALAALDTPAQPAQEQPRGPLRLTVYPRPGLGVPTPMSGPEGLPEGAPGGAGPSESRYLPSIVGTARADDYAVSPTLGATAPVAPSPQPQGGAAPTTQAAPPPASLDDALKIVEEGMPRSNTTGQVLTPEELKNLNEQSPFENFKNAATGQIATLLGAPVGVINEIANKAGEIMQRAVGMDPNDPLNKQFSQHMPLTQVTQWMRKQFENAGLSVQAAPGSKAGEIGEEFVNGLAGLVAMGAMLPTRVGAQAAPGVAAKVKNIIAGMGDFIRAHPYLMSIQELGSAWGAVEAKHAFPDSPLAALLGGALAGGSVANMATKTAQGVGRFVGRTALSTAQRGVNLARGKGFRPQSTDQPYVPFGSPGLPLSAVEYGVARASSPIINALPAKAQYPVMNTLMKGTLAAENLVGQTVHRLQQAPRAKNTVTGAGAGRVNPFRDPTSDVQYARRFGLDQLSQDFVAMENALAQAIDKIPAAGVSAHQLQNNIYAAIEVHAKPIAKKLQQRFWARTKLDRPVPRPDIQNDVRELRAAMEATDDIGFIPRDRIKVLENLVATKQTKDAAGKFQKTAPLTLRKLRSFNNMVSNEIAAEQGKAYTGGAPRQPYIRNLTRLSELVDDAMARAYPNDVEVQQAVAFSKRYNELFTKSNLFDLLARNSRGKRKVNPGESLDFLQKQTEGLSDLFNMTGALQRVKRIPKQKDAYPTALTPQDKQVFKDINDQVKQAFQQQLREVAKESGNDPDTVAKLLRTAGENMGTIRELSNVKMSFEALGKQIESIGALRDMTQRSRLAQYVKADPDVAINTVIGSKDPVAAVRGLMAHFRPDAQAREAFQNTIFDKFMLQTKADPGLMQEVLSAPKTLSTPAGRMRAVMEEAYRHDPDKMARLQRMVKIAADLQSGASPGGMRLIGSTLFGTKMIALKLGSAYSRMTGTTHSLAVGSAFSNLGKQWVTQAFGRGGPTELLKNAINNPDWEKFLLTKDPVTTKDFRQLAFRARTLISSMEGTREAFVSPNFSSPKVMQEPSHFMNLPPPARPGGDFERYQQGGRGKVKAGHYITTTNQME